MTRVHRREFLKTLGTLGTFLAAGGSLGRAEWAAAQADPILAGRPLVRYPEKTDLILLTSRPPQLETPMKYFDRAITPNDAFFVRYHIMPIPTGVDLGTWRLKVGGHVERPLELSMDDLKNRFPRVAVTAVNQCSGNSRGRFAPRVLGGEWGDGAMGNAEWAGVRLREILGMAGVRQGAVDVTFDGLDKPALATVPDFVKSLELARAMDDPDVLVAYEMNGQPLPMLNGFPARLVVPGWYATYWVKNLSEITVLDRAFDGFWVKTAYRIPDTPCGCVPPGTAPKRTVPINRMTVRSFIASPENGARLRAGRPATLKGIAFDGGYGIREVEISDDGGAMWRRAQLGPDLGRYAFREWSATWRPPRPGTYRLMVRAFNQIGESQGYEPLWNPAGYLRNAIEHVDVRVA
jgi:DMSO/TMAO reductase YedYZ molybdopterin-dependent catalytic subunit